MIQEVVNGRAAKVEVAPAAGMGRELRTVLRLLEERLRRGALTVAGPLGPDTELCEHFRELGLREVDADSFRAGTRSVVIPPQGLPRAWRDAWRRAGHELVDLTLPSVRRAQAALGLLVGEGCRPVVVGLKGCPGVRALALDHPASAVVEDADDAARLSFCPRFGVVAPPEFPVRRACLVAEALRQRHRDSRVTFLETASPETLERERSLETLSRRADLVVVLGSSRDASAAGLVGTTRRLGLPVVAAGTPDDPELDRAAGFRRIVLTAGAYVTDESVCRCRRLLEGRI